MKCYFISELLSLGLLFMFVFLEYAVFCFHLRESLQRAYFLPVFCTQRQRPITFLDSLMSGRFSSPIFQKHPSVRPRLRTSSISLTTEI